MARGSSPRATAAASGSNLSLSLDSDDPDRSGLSGMGESMDEDDVLAFLTGRAGPCTASPHCLLIVHLYTTAQRLPATAQRVATVQGLARCSLLSSARAVAAVIKTLGPFVLESPTSSHLKPSLRFDYPPNPPNITSRPIRYVGKRSTVHCPMRGGTRLRSELARNVCEIQPIKSQSITFSTNHVRAFSVSANAETGFKPSLRF